MLVEQPAAFSRRSPLPRIQSTKALIGHIAALALLLFCVQPQTADAQAANFPGTTAVGSSSAPQMMTITVPHGGTIASVKLFGQGTPDVDYVSAGGTCATGTNVMGGGTCTLSVIFSPTSPGDRQGAVVLLDRSNNVLATQLLAARATGSVGVFVPGVISTVAGDGNLQFDGDGRFAVDSSIFLPFGIAVDAAGNLFIADSNNNRIRRVDVTSGKISTVAGSGKIGSIGDGGRATEATLNNPTSVALDPAGNLFFADAGNDVIRRVDAFSGIITTVAGTIGQHGYTGDLGPASHATFNTPNGIAFDADGNLYVADTGNHVIRLIDTSGNITTVAGTGISGYNGDNMPATKATLSAPWSATPITGGGFYIADQTNARIRKVDISGNITTVAGSTAGQGGDGGPATSAQLYQPASVLVDVAGNLYIADLGNNRVRRVNATTSVITTFAGNGSESISGDGGPADQAGLYGPYSFALDPRGNLYIADVLHNRIRKVAANTAFLEYPVIRVDRVSKPMTQALENDGNAPLNFTTFAAVLNSQLDAGTTTCSATTSLAALSQCVIGVDFAPKTIGPNVQGSLNVNSDAGNSPGVINVQGKVLDVNPTTTTLTSGTNPSVTGSTIVFTVTVQSGGITPTGPITLLEGTTVIASSTLQSGGVGTFSVANLPHGSHSLTASYAGDSQNSSGVSSPALIQVVKDQLAATTTSLVTATSPTIAGTPATFTATVNVVTANSGVGNIGGTVALQQGANTIAVANINASTATGSTATAVIPVTNLPVGTDNIVAVYSGNSAYSGSTSSPPVVQTVNFATSTAALSTASNPSTAGATLALTATLTSNGATPTGSVTFMDGSTTLGFAPLNSQGVAILSAAGHFWTVGNHSLTAVYAGDSNNTGSTSSTRVQIVNTATTTTTLISSLTPAGLGANITFTASVTGNGGGPTGTVQFLDGTNPLGTVTLSATNPATASFSTTNLSVGTHSITAVYSGDALDGRSTSTPFTETIQTATIATTIQPSANPVLFNAPLTISVQVTGDGSVPGGTVALQDGSTTIATLPVPANGLILFKNPALTIGTHTLTGVYSGDTNHSAATTSVLTETVQQATSTSISSSLSTLVAGKSVILKAVVTGVSGKPVTGTITFMDGGATIGTVAPDATGTSIFSTTSLAPGTHVLVASYSGDPLDAASASNSTTVSVTIAITTTTFTTSGNPINSGSPLTLTSSVTGNGGMPTGSVTFMDGGSAIVPVQLTTSGTASFTLSTLAPGIHHLSASYSGDTLDGVSISPPIAQQIVQKTTVALTSSTNPSLLQDSVVLTVHVSNGVPTAEPTGSVLILDGTTTLATVIVDNRGTATYNWQAPALGIHSLVAQYAGDNQNSPAASTALTQTVTLRPSTVSFTPSTTSIPLGQQITLISVVQGHGPTGPGGTVTWASGASILGSATVDATGLAAANITPPQGSFNVVAKYSGDSLYAASDSAAIAIAVGPPVEFVIGLTPSKMSFVSGSHGSLNINITTAQNFTDTLALGCAGLPSYATCTFSTNQIAVTNGASPSLTVMVDSGAPLGIGPSALSKQPGTSPTAYECALPAGALLALLLGIHRRKLRRLNRKLLLFSMLVLLTVGSTVLSGCGSSFSQSATPVGSYTFQIVATGNKTGVSQVATVQLTVTK